MKRVLLGLATLVCSAAIAMADQVTVQQGQRMAERMAPGDWAPKTPPQEQVSSGQAPAMLALATPIQLPQANWDIIGLRINIIYGESANFDGLDISALVGRSRGHGNGLQIAGIANIVNGNSVALQIAPVNVVEGDFAGMQIGVANYAASRAGAEAQTWQIGAFNGGGSVHGLQTGVINYAESMVGVQIGLVNIIANKDISFLPIINAAF